MTADECIQLGVALVTAAIVEEGGGPLFLEQITSITSLGDARSVLASVVGMTGAAIGVVGEQLEMAPLEVWQSLAQSFAEQMAGPS